ncbi:tonB-system energizer ExbB [Hyphomicrobium sp.]|uniref:tonB-system energizer ExbB n=1 Tax=Hyphomicrobium sp. TaxID=82 RepID=UPI003F70A88A
MTLIRSILDALLPSRPFFPSRPVFLSRQSVHALAVAVLAVSSVTQPLAAARAQDASPAPSAAAPSAPAPTAEPPAAPAAPPSVDTAAPATAPVTPSVTPLPEAQPAVDAAAASSAPEAPADPTAQAVPMTPGALDAAPEPVAESKPDTSHLPRDLSPWAMFMSADIVVKAVMIGLAFASVVTWTVWLAKSMELTLSRRRLVRDVNEIHAAASLAEAAQRVGTNKGVVAGLIELAALELRLSADVPDKAGMKERISSRLDGLASAAGRSMNKGTGVLATIGSTAPFVGLFGTVWGIMNSFIGISEAQTTNLAIVAPGIAEALLATAIGLVAAIPAVIIYNQFARSISAYKALIGEASAEVMRLVSRDLDRGFKVKAARAAE